MRTTGKIQKRFTDPETGELRPFNDPNKVEEPGPPINQPDLIIHNGHQYVLLTPWQHIEGPITMGPFYARGDVDHREWAFMPDQPYLKGQTLEPSFMHVIQQVASPFTPRPI